MRFSHYRHTVPPQAMPLRNHITPPYTEPIRRRGASGIGATEKWLRLSVFSTLSRCLPLLCRWASGTSAANPRSDWNENKSFEIANIPRHSQGVLASACGARALANGKSRPLSSAQKDAGGRRTALLIRLPGEPGSNSQIRTAGRPWAWSCRSAPSRRRRSAWRRRLRRSG